MFKPVHNFIIFPDDGKDDSLCSTLVASPLDREFTHISRPSPNSCEFEAILTFQNFPNIIEKPSLIGRAVTLPNQKDCWFIGNGTRNRNRGGIAPSKLC